MFSFPPGELFDMTLEDLAFWIPQADWWDEKVQRRYAGR